MLAEVLAHRRRHDADRRCVSAYMRDMVGSLEVTSTARESRDVLHPRLPTIVGPAVGSPVS